MNQLAVAIAIVLFPGLIASVICDKIVVHAQRWDSFKYAIYSFLFGLLSYAALQAVIATAAIFHLALLGLETNRTGALTAWSLVSKTRFELNLFEVVWATAFSPAIAAAAAATINFKLINGLARHLHLSRKYGDENLYSYFLSAMDVDWVYVRDKKAGLTYVGRVRSFSESSGAQELVLADVEVFDYEAHFFQYAVRLVYLSKPVGDLWIEVPFRHLAGHEVRDDR